MMDSDDDDDVFQDFCYHNVQIYRESDTDPDADQEVTIASVVTEASGASIQVSEDSSTGTRPCTSVSDSGKK